MSEALKRIWLVIAVLLMATTLAGCAAVSPGSDRLGLSLKQQLTSDVIAEIDNYHSTHGHYPKSIHLTSVDLSWLPEDARLAYKRAPEGSPVAAYGLALYYAPSGSVSSRTQCVYQSTTRVWNCGEWKQQ